MKVLLLENIKNIGKQDEVVSVSDGYAANFLFPKKLAIPATPSELARHAERAKNAEAEMAKLENLAQRIAKEPLVMKLVVGKDGSIFTSIGKEDVRKALTAKGFDASVWDIMLAKPIRSPATHPVTIRLGHGIEAILAIETAVDK